MSRWPARAVIFLILIFAAAGSVLPAEAKRVALVVGNNAYQALTPLQKAVNDARSVKGVLQELGFTVIDGENLTRRDMNQRLSDLDRAVQPGDQVFVFYAGHGVAIGAENYLLPVDMPLPQGGDEALVRNEGHAADAIIRAIQSRGAATTFVVLDACRNNPIADRGTRNVGLDRGLARMDAPAGVFVLFSAGIGQTALDRLSESESEPNSVFTRKLVPLLKKPGLSHVGLAKELQREVSQLAATIKHRQEPAYYDQIIGEVVLKEGASAPGPAPPPAAAPAWAGEAERGWIAVKEGTSTAALDAYVKQFPGTVYAALAQDRLDKLKREQQAMLAPAPVPVAKPEAKPEPPEPAPAPPASSRTDMAPGTVLRDCPECPEMVVVPAGEFIMGSPDSEKGRKEHEGPQHRVTIGRPFAVGKHEVTLSEWGACVADGKCPAAYLYWEELFISDDDRKKRDTRDARKPVSGVTWDSAKKYTAWLSAKAGKPYRLLSEAEWEYAARAGTTTPYSTGNTVTPEQAHFSKFGEDTTTKVGSFRPNAFGLCDMNGNVAEWVEDTWHYAYGGILAGNLAAPTDGSAWTEGGIAGSRVLRGVTAWLPPRSASREQGTERSVEKGSTTVWTTAGFRVARTLTP